MEPINVHFDNVYVGNGGGNIECIQNGIGAEFLRRRVAMSSAGTALNENHFELPPPIATPPSPTTITGHVAAAPSSARMTPPAASPGNNDSAEMRYYTTKVRDIWALGITIVIGGQYFSWNSGLSAGFGSFVIATVLMGLGYYCLCLCTSELSSTVPFAGMCRHFACMYV
jgi:hypothetical protein